MKKLPKLGALKRKSWRLFSEYIRRRYADKDGFASCITCSKRFHWKDLQASHFLAGRSASILFLESNCHQACYDCNVMRYGHLVNYLNFMLATYGQEKIDELKRIKNQVFKPSRDYYENLIEEYEGDIEIINKESTR